MARTYMKCGLCCQSGIVLRIAILPGFDSGSVGNRTIDALERSNLRQARSDGRRRLDFVGSVLVLERHMSTLASKRLRPKIIPETFK